MSERPRRQRVPALSPDQRRAALIAATIPLLRQHGMAVSTRQIAEAAGVAEGTIFGVFADKTSLIRAALVKAFDPEPVLVVMKEIRHIPDLRLRLEIVAKALARRMAANAPLVAAVRGCHGAPGEIGGPPIELLAIRKRLLDAVTAVIEPDRATLRRSPALAARLLLALVLGNGRGGFGEVETFTSKEIVSLLLDGLLVKHDHEPSQESQRADPALA